MKKSIRMFAVYAPNATRPYTIRNHSREARNHVVRHIRKTKINDVGWKQLYKQGWRVRVVTVR